ncbi:T9SS type A sorting domain-containing protein [Taibaiella soli]|uniref:Secretion system C-terminal sorting domain-containing protein n=1 Tax=Taibaiella soli TaxID=1649169 RepID=A0A2W2BA30_9BACT|nr:T9SS type A sorting domain-containing protein [Taibaiella soli]PZF72757.1 hypothetical protein DN068_12930 [Taibaiella soli]
MKKALLMVLALGFLKAGAADYYWVNGGGNWSDLNHWRLGSSTGSIPSIVPSASDNVFFDANSGFGTTTATKTVTLDAAGFCNNMSWGAVPNSPIFGRSNVAYNVQISGNASLSTTTTYNLVLSFVGSAASTLTTNGNVLGEFGLDVSKTTGSLTLADNLVAPAITNATTTNGISFTSGTFDMSGKTVSVYVCASNNSNTRTWNMSNTTLNTYTGYRYQGTGKTLNATGSLITAGGVITDGGTYNKVISTSSVANYSNIISGTTFKSLTFTASSLAYSVITNGNTIDTLTYAGAGTVGPTNTLGIVSLGGQTNVNSNNTIAKMTATDKLSMAGGNSIDTLLLAANRTTVLAGTTTINKYLKAQGATCQAFTEITAADSAKLVFGPSAAALIDYVYLTNIMASGNITPINVSGLDGGGNTGFNITAPTSIAGTNLYWVGGTGDWNDNTHWSTTSGGTGGACIPSIADTVIFNSGSGLSGGKIVSTTGNAYCYNMSWLPGVGTCTFSQSVSYNLSVYGSVSLNSLVTMNAALAFLGTAVNSTITFNGSSLGTLGLTIRKTGSGALTFADSWTNSGGSMSLASGRVNMQGKTINIYEMASGGSTVRYQDMTGTNIRVSHGWTYNGTNMTLATIGSHVISDYYINISGQYYPYMEGAYTGGVAVDAIAQSTIDSLIFSGTSATSQSQIGNGNTIRRLEFKGAGYITGINTIDSLVLAGSRVYKFNNVNTINKYFQAVSTTCSGLLELRGNTTGTFAFNPAAVINMNNVYLQNMVATGVPPVAVNGADAGGNSGWNITSTAGSAHYWIGGAGDWNDNTHWSATSGGTGGACIPTVSDDVYFDANSGFTSLSKTVTVSNGNAYSRNLNWANATNAPIWNVSVSWAMEIWGDSIILNPVATFNAWVTAKGGLRPAFLKGNVLGNFDLNVDKPGSSLTMLNDFSNGQTTIGVLNGTWNASGINLNIYQVDNSAGTNNVSAMNISNSTVTAPLGWRYQGVVANHSLNATHSSITTNNFKAAGLSYDTVNVYAVINTDVNMAASTVNNLTFTNTSATAGGGIVGDANILHRVEFKGGGIIAGNNNVIDTLIFFPGDTYTFTAGTNTTINNAWYGSGTPCHLTQIASSSPSANATVTRPSGNTTFDYVRLNRITGAGAASFVGQQHTIDQGNNTNWAIAAYNAGAAIRGLGNDTAIAASAFPYTLHTDGFFGVPSSQYLWSNNSTADSLVAADTGRYSVTVNFVDGCTVSDTIHLLLLNPLSITLLNFEAAVQNCQANLNWKVANAVDFKEFVVERSNDGRNFASIVKLAYVKGTGDYAYTDKSINIGASYYRLRLMDVDGSYNYSKVVSVKSDCSAQAIAVYPTVTKNAVTVELPSGYAGAKIEVYNGTGQLVQTIENNNEGKQNLQFNGLAQGQYILKISNGSDVHTFKVIYQL